MWPFRKKGKMEYLDPGELNFTQLDFTERFGDHLSLGKSEWIQTIPMNEIIERKNLSNLPLPGTNNEEVYKTASQLSEIRERFHMPDDGVYCPICHIANVNIENLGTPCPRCDRPLLAFGWT